MTGAFQSVNTMTTEKTRKISFTTESRHMKESLCGSERHEAVGISAASAPGIQHRISQGERNCIHHRRLLPAALSGAELIVAGNLVCERSIRLQDRDRRLQARRQAREPVAHILLAGRLAARDQRTKRQHQK